MKRVTMTERDLRDFHKGRLKHGIASLLSRALRQPLYTLTVDLERLRGVRVAVLFGANSEAYQVELRAAFETQLNCAQLAWQAFDPTLDFVWEEHLDLWEELLANAASYHAAIVVVPSWGPAGGAELAALAARFGKPIVFVDHNPDPRQRYPSNVIHVGVSERAGGQMQGEALVKLNRRKPLRNVFILTGPTKPDRARGIEDMLRWHVPGCVVDICGEGAYHRETAANIVADRLRVVRKAGRRPLDVVVTTSDSMTHGTLDVSRALLAAGDEPPLTMSYDGLSEVRQYVASGAVACTFVQDPAAMAAAAVEQVVNACYGMQPPTRSVYVPGYLYGPAGREPSSATPSKSAWSVEELGGLLKAACEALERNEQALVRHYLRHINARLAGLQ